MKNHNEYHIYSIGEYVSSQARNNEIVMADNDPNLLWYYLDSQIYTAPYPSADTNVQSENGDLFSMSSQILREANEEQIDFIVTTMGTPITNASQQNQFHDIFLPLHGNAMGEGGSNRRIYVRKQRLKDFLSNPSGETLGDRVGKGIWLKSTGSALDSRGVVSTDFKIDDGFGDAFGKMAFSNSIQISTKGNETAKVIFRLQKSSAVTIDTSLTFRKLPLNNSDGAMLSVISGGKEVKVSFSSTGLMLGGSRPNKHIPLDLLDKKISMRLVHDGDQGLMYLDGSKVPIISSSTDTTLGDRVMFGDFSDQSEENLSINLDFFRAFVGKDNYLSSLATIDSDIDAEKLELQHQVVPAMLLINQEIPNRLLDNPEKHKILVKIFGAGGRMVQKTVPLKLRTIKMADQSNFFTLLFLQEMEPGNALITISSIDEDGREHLINSKQISVSQRFKLFPEWWWKYVDLNQMISFKIARMLNVQ